jgi:hypothetical protein
MAQNLHQLINLNPQTVEECEACIKAVDDLMFDVMGIVNISKASKSKRKLDPMKERDFLALEYLLTDEVTGSISKPRATAIKALTKLGSDYSQVKGLSDTQLNRMNGLIGGIVTTYGIKVAEIAEPIINDHMQETMALTRKSIAKGIDKDLFGNVPAFSVKDEKAIEGLSKINRIFIRKEYDENQSNAVRAFMAENLETVGGSASQVAADLSTNLTDYFTKADKNYLNIVATNMLNTSRSYSALSTYDDVDIEEYEILGINDRRQSQICKNLSGKTFSVKKSLEIFDEIASAKTYDDLTSAKPFLSDEVKDGRPTGRMFIVVAGKNKYFDGDVEGALLQKYGVSFPPFHHRCRSTIVAVY